jgi:poly(ADP-ribose) glycohydrolase
MQRIIWPWELKNWTTTKRKLLEKINSIVDMDSKISSMHMGKIRPRQIMELFSKYHNDEQYSPGRVSAETFVGEIIPFMQRVLGDAPKTFQHFDARVLGPGAATNLVLDRVQVLTILVCMWFGLFDYNYITRGALKLDDMPEPTFMNAYGGHNVFILQCLVNYFNRAREYMSGEDTRDSFAAGNIIIKRNQLADVDWLESDKPLAEIYAGEGPTVDDSPAKMQVAFAHEYIGGPEIFKNTLTQEEITLLIRPECLAATLFCARLEPDETVTVFGAEKMSQYAGYGSSVRFTGDYRDTCPRGYSPDDTEVMTQIAVIFMDASPRTTGRSQFMDDFMRDLGKAYCGFNSLRFTVPGAPVATGNWSYGFSGSHMQLKFLQQYLAASQADKSLIYHAFGREFEDQVMVFAAWAHRSGLSVGGLMRLYLDLVRKCSAGKRAHLNDLDLFTCLQELDD